MYSFFSGKKMQWSFLLWQCFWRISMSYDRQKLSVLWVWSDWGCVPIQLPWRKNVEIIICATDWNNRSRAICRKHQHHFVYMRKMMHIFFLAFNWKVTAFQEQEQMPFLNQCSEWWPKHCRWSRQRKQHRQCVIWDTMTQGVQKMFLSQWAIWGKFVPNATIIPLKRWTQRSATVCNSFTWIYLECQDTEPKLHPFPQMLHLGGHPLMEDKILEATCPVCFFTPTPWENHWRWTQQLVVHFQISTLETPWSDWLFCNSHLSFFVSSKMCIFGQHKLNLLFLQMVLWPAQAQSFHFLWFFHLGLEVFSQV